MDIEIVKIVDEQNKTLMELKEPTPQKRGGKRANAGRKKIEGGVRHTWTIPPDILDIAEEKGTEYIWDAVRFKVTFDLLAEKNK